MNRARFVQMREIYYRMCLGVGLFMRCKCWLDQENPCWRKADFPIRLPGEVENAVGGSACGPIPQLAATLAPQADAPTTRTNAGYGFIVGSGEPDPKAGDLFLDSVSPEISCRWKQIPRLIPDVQQCEYFLALFMCAIARLQVALVGQLDQHAGEVG